jgi:hypothetical protein
MEECDSRSRAKLLERSLPKVFRGLRGGEWRAARSMLETIT